MMMILQEIMCICLCPRVKQVLRECKDPRVVLEILARSDQLEILDHKYVTMAIQYTTWLLT